MNDDYLEDLYDNTKEDIEFTVTAVCSTCGAEYPHTTEYFATYYRKSKEHLRFTCINCRKIAVKASYLRNRDKRLIKMRERYQRSKEG